MGGSVDSRFGIGGRVVVGSFSRWLGTKRCSLLFGSTSCVGEGRGSDGLAC